MRIPGSVYGTLLEKGFMPDPYDRMNELEALRLMENDFCFQTTFTIDKEQLLGDFLLLRFDGIDTLTEVYLNDRLLGQTDNMHRVWEFDIEEIAKVGENTLRVEFVSPTKYIAKENEKVYTGGSGECMKGFPHLRKAHCMFGWDWGPRLPDVGIFREVSVLSGRMARLEQVYITQDWLYGNAVDVTPKGVDIHTGSVDIKYNVTIENFVPEMSDDSYEIRTALYDDKGMLIAEKSSGQRADVSAAEEYAETVTADKSDETRESWDTITVHDPKRWWPNGYGKQPLYRAEVTLLDDQGTVLDVWSRRIGLRTMTVNTQQDEWGECFAHEVNGVKIFAMGADYIPEDNILSRVTPERTKKLLQDAAQAHYNCIRVWGGGYYPDDWFYDLCDELGLVVWQDFMFACAAYELDDDFERNVSMEIRDNIRRIRHHACLGLWCGNNEIETQTLDKAWKPSEKQKCDYIKLFEYIIPKILEEEDPGTFYWPSSPSSGGNFDNPWDENRGDTHYWDVWHGNKPFTEYRKFRFRYVSEFGFQSFPCLKTVETFTEPEDRNIFSRVMEMHQRNVAANGKIMTYLSATYLYPTDFDTLLYASQLLQADAIRYGIEHFRRHRGRCMGTIVWQLNDIWPVASWASIDYYGRWKALHYAEKRAFAPIMISCEETGELSERPFCVSQPAPIVKSARLHVANETFEPVSGLVTWKLRTAKGEILLVGEERVRVEPLSGTWIERHDFSSFNELEVYISYSLEVKGQVVSEGTSLFTAPKHFAFEDPKLSYTREGNSLLINAQAYAKSVEIQGVDGDVKLSDNFFDMNPGTKRVEILEGDATEFALRSVYQIR
ncbi:MAG: glycoside hydrolase family 2 protein [Lachnospiraceae bacterium]|nr:glycoside hydrolase family 2 protein [Lachnospiraceae bacterium]MBD5506254.1 glycoside hydrolase family 2 protein [Lachnospiraceae bacterium]